MKTLVISVSYLHRGVQITKVDGPEPYAIQGEDGQVYTFISLAEAYGFIDVQLALAGLSVVETSLLS
jgi:hypothetical protein